MSASLRTPRGRRAGTLTPLELPSFLRYGHRAYGTASGCTVIVAQEPAGPGGAQVWHLSIAHRHRYPTWDEIADVRYQLCPPDVTMAMLLPPPGEYVNVNEHCFHIWEIDDPRV